MFGRKRKPRRYPVAPCPRIEPHRPHFHPGGLAKCAGIEHDCSTMGHVFVALAHAFGCQRCGLETPVD